MKKLLACVGAVFVAGAFRCCAESPSLAGYRLNIDGASSLFSTGGPVPPAVNLAAFDLASGLGTISININAAGPHSASAFVDHEIDQSQNTFFNEFGAAVGSPAPGQSWEIDEPGYRFGKLFTNFVSGNLHNANRVPSSAPDDVAMALAWSFVLTSNQTALIEMTVSESVPTTGFYLSQTDPASSRTIYFSSTLRFRSDDSIPPTITCPADIIASADPGLCSKSSVTYTPTATDNLPGVTVACLPPSASSFNLGTTPVTCTATDAAGNTNSCSFSVTIRAEPPVIK